MAEEQVEDVEDQLKRKAIRDLMSDKSLTPYIGPVSHAAVAASAASKPPPPFISASTTNENNNSYDDKLRAKLDKADNNNNNSRRSSTVSTGSGAMDDFESRLVNKAVVGDGDRKPSAAVAQGSRYYDDGDGDSTIGDSTIGDSTIELGTIVDESDLASLTSKSSTSRNWKDKFRAAALEAKIAAKISKMAGDDHNNEEVRTGPMYISSLTGQTGDEESDTGYTLGSNFTVEREQVKPSSSSHGVGYGSLPMPEEHFFGDGVSFPPVQDSSDIEVLRNSVAPQFSLMGGEEPSSNIPAGLAVATAVARDDEPDYVYAAIEYDPDAKPPLHKNRRFRAYTYLALVLIVVVVALVVVYITSVSKKAQEKDTVIFLTSSPTPKASAAPTTQREAEGIIEQLQKGVLLRNENFESMVANDPRRLALDWILNKDELRLISDSINLYQRYGLAVLAYSMDSKAWTVCGNPGENFTKSSCSVYSKAMNQSLDFGVWLSGVSECNWYGVTCSSDGIVRGVELISNNLVGVLPHELTGNCIYGTIPEEIGQLDNLLSLELHENGLSGELPSTIYQLQKLQLLNLAKQYGVDRICEQSNGTKVYINFKHGGFIPEFNIGLTGKLGPAIGQLRSMKGMYLSENSFSGEFSDDIGNLRYLTFLRVNDNFIEGSLPTTITSLRNLRELRLDDNFLLTSLPEDIADMEDLEALSVNGNSMFGKIPEGLYDLKKLKTLFLHDTAEANYPWLVTDQEGFSGTMSSTVGNLKKLEYLLLNTNPITGQIPSSLGDCTKLKVLRLHRTNLKGEMPREVCLLRDKDLNSEEEVGVLYADCRPDNRTEEPWVQCSCCSDCCDHTTNVCVQND